MELVEIELKSLFIRFAVMSRNGYLVEALVLFAVTTAHVPSSSCVEVRTVLHGGTASLFCGAAFCPGSKGTVLAERGLLLAGLKLFWSGK